MALAVAIVLVLAVLLAVGLFAAGRLDGMSEAVADVPPGLPDGPVTPEGLRGVRLPVSLRGYRMADVDELIERAATELATERRARPTPGLAPEPATGPRIDKPRPYASPTSSPDS